MARNMNMVMEMVKSIQNGKEHDKVLCVLSNSKAKSYNMEEAVSTIEKAIKDITADIATNIWDLFTDHFGLTEAQFDDYEYFDEMYEKLEKGGTTGYLTIDVDFDLQVKFLNPIPTGFLVDYLKPTLADEGFQMFVDTEEDFIAIV